MVVIVRPAAGVCQVKRRGPGTDHRSPGDALTGDVTSPGVTATNRKSVDLTGSGLPPERPVILRARHHLTFRTVRPRLPVGDAGAEPCIQGESRLPLPGLAALWVRRHRNPNGLHA
jgi:hypothetical protein